MGFCTILFTRLQLSRRGLEFATVTNALCTSVLPRPPCYGNMLASPLRSRHRGQSEGGHARHVLKLWKSPCPRPTYAWTSLKGKDWVPRLPCQPFHSSSRRDRAPDLQVQASKKTWSTSILQSFRPLPHRGTELRITSEIAHAVTRWSIPICDRSSLGSGCYLKTATRQMGPFSYGSPLTFAGQDVYLDTLREAYQGGSVDYFAKSLMLARQRCHVASCSEGGLQSCRIESSGKCPLGQLSI